MKMKVYDEYFKPFLVVWVNKERKFYGLPAKETRPKKDPTEEWEKEDSRNCCFFEPPNNLKVIDTSSLSYLELKNICTQNNLGIGLIEGVPCDGIDFSDEIDVKSRLKSLCLSESIKSFIFQFSKNTARSYENSWDTILHFCGLDESIETRGFLEEYYDDIVRELTEGSDRVKWVSKNSRYCCIRMLSSLKKYIENGEVKSRRKKSSKSDGRVDSSPPRAHLKTQRLSASEFKALVVQLKKINPIDALAAQLCRQVNRQLSRENTYVSMESILRLEVIDISWETNMVNFWRRNHDSTSLVSLSLPQYIMIGFTRIVDSTSPFVFHTTSGGPVFPTQLERNLRKAGERAGIEFSVTSLNLRIS